MEIKVGQWVRTKNNHFARIHQNDLVCLKETNGSLAYDTREKDDAMIIKVSNTPQELIDVGDLVKINGYKDTLIIEVSEYYDDTIDIRGAGYELDFNINNVIAIYTPNSNGGYDLQWEEE